MSKKKRHNYVDQAPVLIITDVAFSPHSLQRILERELDPLEVRQAIERPTSAYWSRQHEAWIYTRGRVGVGLTPHREYADKWAVKTVINADLERRT